MTPKEKAEELVNKFIKPTIKWNPVNGVGYYNDLNAAKECALVAVNEIMDALEKNGNWNYDYWQEVKEEICSI